jgi:hypothetical protein
MALNACQSLWRCDAVVGARRSLGTKLHAAAVQKPELGGTRIGEWKACDSARNAAELVKAGQQHPSSLQQGAAGAARESAASEPFRMHMQGIRASHSEFKYIDGREGGRADEVYTTQDASIAGKCLLPQRLLWGWQDMKAGVEREGGAHAGLET